MRYILNLVPLFIAVMFALSLRGDKRPLFVREDLIPVIKKPDIRTSLFRVWQSRKANGLVKYHFKNDTTYEELWARNRETAVRKFMARNNIISMEKWKGAMAGLEEYRQSAIFLAEIEC